MTKITKDTKISLILNSPKAKKILEKYNFPCLACPLARFEMDKLTIEEICQMYNIDIKGLLKELNK